MDRVFFDGNFVTITKKTDVEWLEIQSTLKDFLKKYLEAGKLVIDVQDEEPLPVEEETEAIKKIKTILDEYIRPAVEQDGGAITYHSFTDGVVKVKLQGSCSGCPSSTITLKAGIENLFTRMMPGEVKSVEALNEIHLMQTTTHLKLTTCSVGLLINFNVLKLKDGIRRVANRFNDVKE